MNIELKPLSPDEVLNRISNRELVVVSKYDTFWIIRKSDRLVPPWESPGYCLHSSVGDSTFSMDVLLDKIKDPDMKFYEFFSYRENDE